jgi:nitroreductase
MEVYECIRARRTIREFKPDPVSETVITRVLRAGRWAPSSRNQQPWHFIVVKDPDTLKSLGGIASSGRFVADAPVVIALAMENADRPDLDAGRALQQMELVAWSEGLGTCFVNLRVEEQNRRVKELLGIPAGIELIALLPFGYRLDISRTGGTPRNPLSKVAHTEKFGQPYLAPSP